MNIDKQSKEGVWIKEKYIRFGQSIRKRRIESPQELTMLDVANHLGISMSYMSEMENCRRKPLTVLIKLNIIFDLPFIKWLSERFTESETSIRN